MKSKKLCGWIICLAVLAALVIGCSIYAYAGKRAGAVGAQDYELLATEPLGRSSICTAADGACYTLSFSGTLRREDSKGAEIIALAVKDMLPAGNGVAYRRGSTLHYRAEGKDLVIAKNVDHYAWNGRDLLYLIEDTLYCDQEALAVIPDQKAPLGMVANAKFVVFWDQRWVYMYTSEDGITQLPVRYGSPQTYILYNDRLIIVGMALEGAMVYSFPDDTLVPIDVGVNCAEGMNKIAVAGDESGLYLSIWSRSTVLGESVAKGTCRIDTATWTVEHWDSEFHSAMVCGSDGLYGMKKLSVCVKEIPKTDEAKGN